MLHSLVMSKKNHITYKLVSSFVIYILVCGKLRRHFPSPMPSDSWVSVGHLHHISSISMWIIREHVGPGFGITVYLCNRSQDPTNEVFLRPSRFNNNYIMKFNPIVLLFHVHCPVFTYSLPGEDFAYHTSPSPRNRLLFGRAICIWIITDEDWSRILKPSWSAWDYKYEMMNPKKKKKKKKENNSGTPNAHGQPTDFRRFGVDRSYDKIFKHNSGICTTHWSSLKLCKSKSLHKPRGPLRSPNLRSWPCILKLQCYRVWLMYCDADQLACIAVRVHLHTAYICRWTFGHLFYGNISELW